jgi:thiamine biosynthesis protein ThiS
MKITINGEAREIPESLSVIAMLAHLELPPERVAVERNREILPRARWKETIVQPGDSYEIVHLVGGG